MGFTDWQKHSIRGFLSTAAKSRGSAIHEVTASETTFGSDAVSFPTVAAQGLSALLRRSAKMARPVANLPPISTRRSLPSIPCTAITNVVCGRSARRRGSS
jgi:hypothetical protein